MARLCKCYALHLLDCCCQLCLPTTSNISESKRSMHKVLSVKNFLVQVNFFLTGSWVNSQYLNNPYIGCLSAYWKYSKIFSAGACVVRDYLHLSYINRLKHFSLETLEKRSYIYSDITFQAHLWVFWFYRFKIYYFFIETLEKKTRTLFKYCHWIF